MALPLFLMGVFAIYSQNHEINDNTLQVHENLKVDFNQLRNGWNMNVDPNNRWYVNNDDTITIDGTFTERTIIGFTPRINFYQNHVYICKTSNTPLNVHLGTWALVFENYENNTSRSICNTTNYNALNLDIISSSYPVNIQANYSICIFDLTQMFGAGNEPTIAEFNALFPNSYYPYTESQEMYIENAYTTTYDDTDIMSQFMYVTYNAMDKYLNFSKYHPFDYLYTWTQNTFFNGNAPMVFFVMYQLMMYWLIMSLFWLVFDIMLYVPSMIHQMIDKARLE